MSHLYFVRHGQTVWNVENKICGATDSPLTDVGRQQAYDTANEILRQNIKADYIIYSPLSRARDTALIISEVTGIMAREEPRLIEQHFGVYEGTPRDGARFQESKKQFATNYEGGESMLKLCQRIYNVLDDVLSDSEHTYILVAHNGIARAVHSYFNDLTNDDYAAFGIKNCEVKKYEW
ncbi:MAG: histidine phosphatase family protein [Pseudobutyrivibrio sp.]|nr:histidine phosphatase family protein [Pseudobutyrivibrio sp.]